MYKELAGGLLFERFELNNIWREYCQHSPFYIFGGIADSIRINLHGEI